MPTMTYPAAVDHTIAVPHEIIQRIVAFAYSARYTFAETNGTINFALAVPELAVGRRGC